MATLTYNGQLTIVTCWCGTRHAVPSELRAIQLAYHRDGRDEIDIYCPLGHIHVPAGKGEAQLLRERLEREQKRAKATRELLDHEQRSHAATRGHLTRTKKRIDNGVCPCCNRSFANVERHMKSKHPDYAESNGGEPEERP